MVICPEASSAHNNMAAVSAQGSTVWVLIRRLNSSCNRSIAFEVRIDFHWLGGKRVKVNSLSPVRPHAERDEHRDRGRLPVEPNARDRAVEDQPDDRLLGERAPIPGIPIALHLAPGPADHVLADRPSERRGKRPPHPAGVGSRKIGPGDQGVGGPGAALIGAQRTAPPFARLAVVPHQPSARHGDPRLAKRARQRPFAMAVAHADNRRRRLVLPRSAPAVARTRQRLAQFLLQHRARTPSSIASNQSSKSKPSAAAAASFVVSFVMAWSPFQRASARIIWVEQPGDYANPIPTTSATGPASVTRVTDDTAPPC